MPGWKKKNASTVDELAALLGLPPAKLRAARREIPSLHGWYRRAARDLPWRRTRDPYAIWVSEVMLQQTQVATALPYYRRWMSALPTLRDLAAADEDAVLRLWEGLGYYSRALNLRRAARACLERWQGELPRTADELRSLPGFGPYTTAAVLSIAHGIELPAVDGNVRRVLARLAALAVDLRRPPWTTALEELARFLLPPRTASLHNQAMMELGALICSPRAPACPACPLAGACLGRARGDPTAFPVTVRRSATPHHQQCMGLVLYRGAILVGQRPHGALLGGLWEPPAGDLRPGELPAEALARALGEPLGRRLQVHQLLPTVGHAYSHFRVTIHPLLCSLTGRASRAAEPHRWRWVPLGELPDLAMPRAARKVLEALAWPPTAPLPGKKKVPGPPRPVR